MLTPPTVAFPPGPLTEARRSTVRHELQEADKHLNLALTENRYPETRREHIEFAQAAVRDALRWIDDNGDPATVLVALEGIRIQDISNPAATHVDLARAMLRRP